MIEQQEFGPLLAEGKTKLLYAYPDDDNLAYMVNKDQITAGDGERRNELAGKSRWSTITTANVFRLLNEEGIATHFVKQINATNLLVKRCKMLPIEQVQRRIANNCPIGFDARARIRSFNQDIVSHGAIGPALSAGRQGLTPGKQPCSRQSSGENEFCSHNRQLNELDNLAQLHLFSKPRLRSGPSALHRL